MLFSRYEGTPASSHCHGHELYMQPHVLVQWERRLEGVLTAGPCLQAHTAVKVDVNVNSVWIRIDVSPWALNTIACDHHTTGGVPAQVVYPFAHAYAYMIPVLRRCQRSCRTWLVNFFFRLHYITFIFCTCSSAHCSWPF